MLIFFLLLFIYKIGEHRAELVVPAEAQEVGGRRGETVKEGEYCANTVYTCV
jgi:hypothetical protein